MRRDCSVCAHADCASCRLVCIGNCEHWRQKLKTRLPPNPRRFAAFTIRVASGDNHWHVQRRYSQFQRLDAALRAQCRSRCVRRCHSRCHSRDKDAAAVRVASVCQSQMNVAGVETDVSHSHHWYVSLARGTLNPEP